MPRPFAALPEDQRRQNVEAIVHFLASTGKAERERPDRKQIATGFDLYHKVGCVACHGTRTPQGTPDKTFALSVPLPDVRGKYHLAGLRAFLQNPHQTRPSGRMPRLLNGKEAQEIANYLLQGIAYDTPSPNLNYAYYEGSWDKLPDLAKLKPRATGTAGGFDVTLARRANDFALKFDGFLKIDRAGDYRFHVTSDDGSKLWIDDKLVVVNDGIHPPQTVTGKAKLTKGVHKLTVGLFNGGGGVELGVQIEGPGIGRQEITPYVFLTPQGNPAPKTPVAKTDDGPLEVQPALAEKGRALFASAGCANCHQLNLGQRVASTLQAPALASLKPDTGCLAPAPTGKAPWFGLDTVQRRALAAATKSPVPAGDVPANESIGRVMATFNCYACHERNKVGGATEQLNPYFKTAQPEMGDEGRLPPPLTGVGAKLNAEYLRHLLDEGAHDRPYMFTRMPGFGNDNVGVLVTLFANADPAPAAPKVALTARPQKIKAEARHLIGGQALGCIKCHTFAGHKAEGVQGIDMTLMTRRLKHDWFHNYLLNPNKYRPGTRMPAAWPDGQVMLPKFLGGSADKQIEGVWVYLSAGNKALLPVGLKKQSIPLVPTTEAIVYRNFIEGGGPRAIAVGYPEHANLCFDANNLRLAMIWQGAFIDAARHWTDRGVGYEPPLGDNILHLPTTVGFAVLEKPDAPWPTKSARDLAGYHFAGYRLGKDRRPTFLYEINGVKVEDFPNAVQTKEQSGIRRELTVTGDAAQPLFFRAAAGTRIEPLGDGWYRINGEWRMRIQSDARPVVRTSGGQTELLVPIPLHDGKTRIVQEYQW
jgi:mono/diheme cytochrome c family protein